MILFFKDYRMNTEKFDSIVKNRLQQIEQVLMIKAKEYATGGDRLHNFRVAGKRRQITPERALDGFLLKHEVSMGDIINNLDKGKVPSKELLNEKIGDIINYYVLLEACIIERIEKNESLQQTLNFLDNEPEPNSNAQSVGRKIPGVGPCRNTGTITQEQQVYQSGGEPKVCDCGAEGTNGQRWNCHCANS